MRRFDRGSVEIVQVRRNERAGTRVDLLEQSGGGWNLTRADPGAVVRCGAGVPGDVIEDPSEVVSAGAGCRSTSSAASRDKRGQQQRVGSAPKAGHARSVHACPGGRKDLCALCRSVVE